MENATKPTSQPDDEVNNPLTDDDAAPSTQHYRNRWKAIASILGIVAICCAVAFPFLPTIQHTAQILWPNGTDTRPVNAPLTGYWAQDMQVDLPCATIQSVDKRSSENALLFSTVPAQRAENGTGMQLWINNGLLTATNQGQQVATQPLPPSGCDVRIASDADNTALVMAGITIYDGSGDVRPRVVGIYTDIDNAQDPIDGLRVTITPDTRYQSSPTVLKIAVGAIGVIAIIGCFIAVNRLDSGRARRAPRWAPVGWWRLTGRDITVIGALGAWVFIGPVTSDDGYILTMARASENAGFMANYHRWFGVAEAPFGWFYHLYELMIHVSTVPPWIRLPSFVLGVVSWLLISREVMPRLGSQVRVSKAAGWAAAAVFLVWWMPFNNGVRPEPVAAVGSLLALCAVERALVTRRLLPLCLGLLAAAFTLAATPTGLIAVAPFLVAARPLFQLLRARAKDGWLPVLAPIFGAGLLVLIVIFADQTFASVSEATRIRTSVGPNHSWFEELARYELLFESSADGSAIRRFPVLLLILCTGACLVVLLRRGRIPGAALGPSRRLIGTVALFFVLMALTPTKWTHHFGAFAAVGAAMAALTALATGSTVLRSRRNRAAFLAGLLVVGALAATGPNSYWFVSNIGVPWSDRAISFFGIGLSTILLIAAAIAAAFAFVENVRAHRPDASNSRQEKHGRSLRLGSVSLVAVCGLVAAGEFASMAIPIRNGLQSYSLAATNVKHLFGKNCGLSDQVMVERDPISSVLSATNLPTDTSPADQQNPPPSDGSNPLPEQMGEGSGKTEVGFHTTPQHDEDPLEDAPHGFTAPEVSMWSSYIHDKGAAGRLRTDWYELPDDRENGQVVVAVAAGKNNATTASVEYGSRTSTGVKVVGRKEILSAGGGAGGWVDSRLELRTLPAGTDFIRIVGQDDDLTEEGWLAVTAPRVPSFTTLTDRLGDKPVYMDWPTSFVYPCIEPVQSRDGISDMPAYRISAGSLASEASWANSAAGGPNGWIEEVSEQPEVPSFMTGNPRQSWGQLRSLEPFAEGTTPLVIRGSEVHPGWWSPGPGPTQPNGDKATR